MVSEVSSSGSRAEIFNATSWLQAFVPPHTPHASTSAVSQQKPAASSWPAQHLPCTSTAVAGPSHTPHASSTPDAQHAPWASIVALAPSQHRESGMSTPRQQVPLVSNRPLHPAEVSQYVPVKPASHAHCPEEHVPRPLHVLSSQKSQAAGCPGAAPLHRAVPLGRVVPSHSVADGVTPNAELPDEHLTDRLCSPSQVLEHGDHADTTHEYTWHLKLLQGLDVAGFAPATPPERQDASGTVSPVPAFTHVTLRIAVPKSQRFEHSPQPLVAHLNVGHTTGSQAWVSAVGGDASRQRQPGTTAPLEDTHSAWRVRLRSLPLLHEGWHSPYAVYFHAYDSQG